MESYQAAQELSSHYLERAYIRISYVSDNPDDPKNDDFLEEAALFLEAARFLSPNNSKVFHYLGLIAFQENEFSLAIRYFEKAGGLNPSDFKKDEFIQGLKEEIEERLGIKTGSSSGSPIMTMLNQLKPLEGILLYGIEENKLSQVELGLVLSSLVKQ